MCSFISTGARPALSRAISMQDFGLFFLTEFDLWNGDGINEGEIKFGRKIVGEKSRKDD